MPCESHSIRPFLLPWLPKVEGMKRICAVAISSVLLLSGCSSTSTTQLEGFDGRSAQEIITELDQTPVADRATNLMASIRADELILSDQSGQLSIDMPADEFYISAAPYTTTTHECFYHSLTTCTGELANTPVKVTVVADNGETIFEEDTITYDNGFVGMWLPRNIDATLTIEHDGLKSTQPISTGDDAPTCITTAELA